MKRNKYFLILSIAWLLSSWNNLFPMNNKELKPYEKFTKLKKINLKHKGDKAISRCGKYIASSGGSRHGEIEVIVYDIENNTQKCSYQHNREVTGICFSPDSNYVASGGEEGRVIVYDIENNKQKCSYQHNREVTRICFSPDSNYVASGGEECRVIVYDIENNKQKCSYYCHFDRTISFSPDGRYIASGGVDFKVIVYDIENNTQKNIYKQEHSVTGVSFSPDSKLLASSGKAVILHDIENNEQKSSHPNDWINCFSFSPNGKYIVLGREYGHVLIYDIKNNTIKVLYSHHSRVACLSFSSDGKYVVTGGRDNQVIVYDIENNKQKCYYFHGHDSAGNIECVCFSPDGDTLISVDFSGQIKIFKTSCEFSLNQKCFKLKKDAGDRMQEKIFHNPNYCDIKFDFQ